MSETPCKVTLENYVRDLTDYVERLAKMAGKDEVGSSLYDASDLIERAVDAMQKRINELTDEEAAQEMTAHLADMKYFRRLTA